jgi:hypothetical protein
VVCWQSKSRYLEYNPRLFGFSRKVARRRVEARAPSERGLGAEKSETDLDKFFQDMKLRPYWAVAIIVLLCNSLAYLPCTGHTSALPALPTAPDSSLPMSDCFKQRLYTALQSGVPEAELAAIVAQEIGCGDNEVLTVERVVDPCTPLADFVELSPVAPQHAGCIIVIIIVSVIIWGVVIYLVVKKCIIDNTPVPGPGTPYMTSPNTNFLAALAG